MTTPETIKIGAKEVTKYGPAQLSVSASNRLYHHCDFVEQRRSYSVCAGLVDAYLEQREWTLAEDSETSCVVAMRREQCAALQKRQLELKLDACLFYVERISVGVDVAPVGARERESYRIGWNKVGASLRRAQAERDQANPVPTPTPAPAVVPSGADVFANAINEAVKHARP